MEELNALERTLLEGLVNKYPSLKSHLPYLRVAGRKISGKGMQINLLYEQAESLPRTEAINALFSNGELIELGRLKQGLGYVIDVTDGEITLIELMTNGEVWDGQWSDFNILPNE